MEKFNSYNKDTISNLISLREGETKFGEKIQFSPSLETLKNSTAKYVIFGIPEDIGVRANHGKPGTSTAWKAFLSSFLNLQANEFNQPKNCLLLGEIDCGEWMAQAETVLVDDPRYLQKLGDLVAEIDILVSETVFKIVSAGKTPIIIGGGHNNAFGNIKGTSTALKKSINVLNIDAHTDLRTTDYRHSGNGFSYALEAGFMEKYLVFGLHKNYTSHAIFEKMKASKNLDFHLFENLLKMSSKEKENALQQSVDFLGDGMGLEIDCDAIANFQSSAMTPSGFSVNEVRNFIDLLKNQSPHYLHICEASAKENPMIGKALAYFVSDFIRRDLSN